MSEPMLHGRYGHNEAIVVFGSDHESPMMSHCTNGGELCWVAENPAPRGKGERMSEEHGSAPGCSGSKG